ncbi:MAG TPA: helix-turn-helix domain-containing protein [Firmicutes bacterium]|nr:helix-turn-helix domain-containing protein [Bacillota bacterium]
MKTDRIRELAKQSDLSLAFLCRRIGVAKVYFNDIDKSGRDIPDYKLSVIADILNTTPEYLRGETDVKEKPAGNKADELSDYDARVLAWFRSLPPEKRKAILEIGDGPKE